MPVEVECGLDVIAVRPPLGTLDVPEVPAPREPTSRILAGQRIRLLHPREDYLEARTATARLRARGATVERVEKDGIQRDWWGRVIFWKSDDASTADAIVSTLAPLASVRPESRVGGTQRDDSIDFAVWFQAP